MFDLISVLNEKRINYIPENNRGFVTLPCPFCGEDIRSPHLGYNAKLQMFSCWKCGVKPFKKTLQMVLGIDKSELELILKEYQYFEKSFDNENVIVKPKTLVLPREFVELSSPFKKYLRGRGFDWKELVNIWNLKACSEGRYKNRIIIPIYYQGKLVSFHSRDITGNSKLKAIACDSDKEVICHKDTLLGFDLVPSNTVIVTEGPFDAFRFGRGTVATFGIGFSEAQISKLSLFRNIFICFDSEVVDGEEREKVAQERAEELADSLSVRNNVWIINGTKSDPGSMSEKQANRVLAKIKEILKKEQEKNVSDL